MKGKLTACDFAQVSDGGKYNAIGAGIRNLTTPSFPHMFSFSILLETHFTKAESGKDYPWEINMIDDDGKKAGPQVHGVVKVPKGADTPLYMALGLQMGSKKPGSVTLSLLLNGEEKDSIRLCFLRREKEVKEAAN